MGTVLLTIFVISWAAIATIAFKYKQSKTIAVGGGFIGAVLVLIATATVVETGLKVDATDETTQMASSPAVDTRIQTSSPERLFDMSVPVQERIQLARAFVAGEYHTLEVGPVHSNYTLKDTGEWTASECAVWGEVSERKYVPSGTGRWDVQQKRFRDTGLIYYSISLDPHSEYRPTDFILDRDKGLVRYQGGDPPAKAEQGHISTCL